MGKMKDLDLSITEAVESAYWDPSINTPAEFSKKTREYLEAAGIDWWLHRDYIAKKVREIHDT